MTEPKGPVIWERITVRRVPPDSYIGEARLHCHFAVGEISKDPAKALVSAEQALIKELADLMAKKAKTQAKKACVVTPDLDDLL